MKEPGRAAWTAEMEANRTLTIRPRGGRRRLRLSALVVGALVMAGGVALAVSRSDRGAWETVGFHIGLAGLAVFVGDGLRTAYGLLTGSPVLTIDGRGVELGRRRLRWTQVQCIDLRPASPVLRYLAVRPPAVRLVGTSRSQYIDVTHDHISDLESFADWLRAVQWSEAGESGDALGRQR
jgi:hypothetical protein